MTNRNLTLDIKNVISTSQNVIVFISSDTYVLIQNKSANLFIYVYWVNSLFKG